MGESRRRPACRGRTKQGVGRCTPNSDMAKSLTGRCLKLGESARYCCHLARVRGWGWGWVRVRVSVRVRVRLRVKVRVGWMDG